jgi:hypothetical protein
MKLLLLSLVVLIIGGTCLASDRKISNVPMQQQMAHDIQRQLCALGLAHFVANTNIVGLLATKTTQHTYNYSILQAFHQSLEIYQTVATEIQINKVKEAIHHFLIVF